MNQAAIRGIYLGEQGPWQDPERVPKPDLSLHNYDLQYTVKAKKTRLLFKVENLLVVQVLPRAHEVSDYRKGPRDTKLS